MHAYLVEELVAPVVGGALRNLRLLLAILKLISLLLIGRLVVILLRVVNRMNQALFLRLSAANLLLF